MIDVTVRLAEEADAESVAALAAQLGYATDVSAMRDRLTQVLASATRDVAVATSRGAIVAWIEIEERENLAGGASAEITGLVVDGRARRTGAGRALVAWARAWARDRGLDRLRVRSNAIREEAAGFYAAVGFTLEKMQRVFIARP